MSDRRELFDVGPVQFFELKKMLNAALVAHPETDEISIVRERDNCLLWRATFWKDLTR